VAAFIRTRPALLDAFPTNPAASGRAWPSRRTWTMTADVLALLAEDDADAAYLAASGLVGEGAAVEYLTWRREADLPDPTAVVAEGLGTFAVDRAWRLYVDPVTLGDWGPQLAGGVLVHEVGHLLRAHAERGDALGSDYDHDRWNLSGDIAINDDLMAAGIRLP